MCLDEVCAALVSTCSGCDGSFHFWLGGCRDFQFLLRLKYTGLMLLPGFDYVIVFFYHRERYPAPADVICFAEVGAALVS
jgi:hypothetical protein